MRRLVFILIGFIAVVTFIRAFDYPGIHNTGLSSLDISAEISDPVFDKNN
ncbi:MAG: hypothetical protein LBT95_04790 [Treponema sp.]|jgi:hypothetical protein|nr:hypothetical protein [Treponema sp.]